MQIEITPHKDITSAITSAINAINKTAAKAQERYLTKGKTDIYRMKQEELTQWIKNGRPEDTQEEEYPWAKVDAETDVFGARLGVSEVLLNREKVIIKSMRRLQQIEHITQDGKRALKEAKTQQKVRAIRDDKIRELGKL